MLKWMFRKRKPPVLDDPPAAEDVGALVELSGRKVQRNVKPVIGLSILELAEKNKVDWLSNCKRGTCARCRCFVIEGKQFLSEPNTAELERLEPEEIEQGFRLACQTKIVSNGKVIVRHAPYF